MASVGASVAKDSDAKLSMIRFTHSCTATTISQPSSGTHTPNPMLKDLFIKLGNPVMSCLHILALIGD